jgi:hypothetical protein
MKKCEFCGCYFSWWERLTKVAREHVRMCEVIAILRNERDTYRSKLIDSNIENSRLRLQMELEHKPQVINWIDVPSTNNTPIDYECPADCGCRQ